MTLEELIKKLKELGLSDDVIKQMASCYDLGYAQGLCENKKISDLKD